MREMPVTWKIENAKLINGADTEPYLECAV
jgi:hypothetical protein